MAKKFKFKLDGLLKVRHFKEEQLKVDLGQVNQEIAQVKARIAQLQQEIDDSYIEQEKVLESSSNGQLAKFFPYYIEAKREDIKNNENLLYALEKKFQKKLAEVNKAMGDSKVISDMKDKHKAQWKKDYEKKSQADIDEVLSMRRAFKGNDL